MLYQTEFEVKADPGEVFDALHQYKRERNPNQFFLSPFLQRVVNMQFQVLTPHAVRLGAIYSWKVLVLGVALLQFEEEVVAWEPASLAAYKAMRGWEMSFRTILVKLRASTRARVELEMSIGNGLFDRLLRPLVEFGLRRVCEALIRRGIRRRRGLGAAA
jgi:hypothetical protein